MKKRYSAPGKCMDCKGFYPFYYTAILTGAVGKGGITDMGAETTGSARSGNLSFNGTVLGTLLLPKEIGVDDPPAEDAPPPAEHLAKVLKLFENHETIAL